MALLRRLSVLLLLVLADAVPAQEGLAPWENYAASASSRSHISPLSGDSIFGDSVDFYSGVLSFSVTDIHIPGSGPPVGVGRKFAAASNDRRAINDHAFADWDINIPNVSGTFGPDWHPDRCTKETPPIPRNLINPEDYWSGNYSDMDGGGPMLRVDSPRPSPQDGRGYLWVTPGNTYFSCLESIRNGAGQGFLAVASDGTRYWFDHLAQYYEDGLSIPTVGAPDARLIRKKNSLYVTRVEDRFGNWVQYSYSNAYNRPVKVDSIVASDGRRLDFAYNQDGYISSVSDGSRVWAYSYTRFEMPYPRGSSISLSRVALPDGASWSYEFSGLASLDIPSVSDDMRMCTSMPIAREQNVVGVITHPSGAKGTFVVGLGQMGRTNVPIICGNYSEALKPPGMVINQQDDYLVIPAVWWSWVPKSKVIEGAGLGRGEWSYTFTGGGSWLYRPGQTKPICQSLDCLEPICVSDCVGRRVAEVVSPDGTWERYEFGNSYLYNEGQLLRYDVGYGPGNVLKSVYRRYNHADGQAYSPRLGRSPHGRSDAVFSTYVRPLIEERVEQQGRSFVWSVDRGCGSADTYCFDSLARPTRVTRSGALPAPTATAATAGE